MTSQSVTSSNWNDFNDAESQQSGFDLIPKGTVVPVRMTLKHESTGGGSSGAPAQAAAPSYQAPAPQRAPVTGKPSWAQ